MAETSPLATVRTMRPYGSSAALATGEVGGEARLAVGPGHGQRYPVEPPTGRHGGEERSHRGAAGELGPFRRHPQNHVLMEKGCQCWYVVALPGGDEPVDHLAIPSVQCAGRRLDRCRRRRANGRTGSL
jgi:hypothetical protein